MSIPISGENQAKLVRIGGRKSSNDKGSLQKNTRTKIPCVGKQSLAWSEFSVHALLEAQMLLGDCVWVTKHHMSDPHQKQFERRPQL